MFWQFVCWCFQIWEHAGEIPKLRSFTMSKLWKLFLNRPWRIFNSDRRRRTTTSDSRFIRRTKDIEGGGIQVMMIGMRRVLYRPSAAFSIPPSYSSRCYHIFGPSSIAFAPWSWLWFLKCFEDKIGAQLESKKTGGPFGGVQKLDLLVVYFLFFSGRVARMGASHQILEFI